MKMLKHQIGRGQRRRVVGLTMIEMLLALTLLGVMLIAVGLTSRKVSDSFDEGNAYDALNSKVHRAMEQILAPIEGAAFSSLQPIVLLPNGTSTITYQPVTGWAGAAPQLGVAFDVQLELDVGELDDGIDNDGDGLIDEGTVVLIEDPGGLNRREVICRGVAELLEGELDNNLDDNGNGLVDEAGLSFDLKGVNNVLTLRMTVLALDPAGRMLTRTAVSAVRIRN